MHWTVLLKVVTEYFDIHDEGLNVLNELFFEVGLVVMESVSDDKCLADKVVPLFLEIFALVKLITVHIQAVLNQSVHVADGLELEVDV